MFRGVRKGDAQRQALTVGSRVTLQTSTTVYKALEDSTTLQISGAIVGVLSILRAMLGMRRGWGGAEPWQARNAAAGNSPRCAVEVIRSWETSACCRG